MEKKTYYIHIGYCGPLCKTPGNRKYGHKEFIVPVVCTEEELETVAYAIGRGYLADSVVVHDHENATNYERPYWVAWDCM